MKDTLISFIAPDADVEPGNFERKTDWKQSTMFCYRKLAECPPMFQAICFSYTGKSVENLKSTSAKRCLYLETTRTKQ